MLGTQSLAISTQHPPSLVRGSLLNTVSIRHADRLPAYSSPSGHLPSPSHIKQSEPLPPPKNPDAIVTVRALNV